jgi:RNA polymerase sigma-70 factor, ECF subfamily
MNFADLADDALVCEASANANAFSVLYERYLPQVFAYVASRLPCRTEAEDVTSDIWMKILANISHFRPNRRESVPAWIFPIARNTLTDAHRKRREHADVDAEDIVAIAGDDPHPGSAIDRRLQFLEFQKHIDALPDHQARCIRLRYYAGLRNQQIAKIEGLREKTVAVHISRGLATLRQTATSLAFPFLA